MSEPETQEYLQSTPDTDSIPQPRGQKPNANANEIRKRSRPESPSSKLALQTSGHQRRNSMVNSEQNYNPYDEEPMFPSTGPRIPAVIHKTDSTPDFYRRASGSQSNQPVIRRSLSSEGLKSNSKFEGQGGPRPTIRKNGPPLSKSAYYQAPTVLDPSYPPPSPSLSYMQYLQAPAGASEYIAQRVISRPLASRFHPMRPGLSNTAMNALDLEKGKDSATAREPVFESHDYSVSNYGAPHYTPRTGLYRSQHMTAIDAENYASTNRFARYELPSASRKDPGTYNANGKTPSVVSAPSKTKNLQKSRRERWNASSVAAKYGSDDDRDGRLHERKAISHGNHMAIDDDEDVTIKVTGQARIMMGGAQIDCESGGEITITRAKGVRIGSKQIVSEGGVKQRERPSIPSTRRSSSDMHGKPDKIKADPGGDHKSVEQQVTGFEPKKAILDASDYEIDLEMPARIDRKSPPGTHGYVGSLDNPILHQDEANTSDEAQSIAMLLEHEGKDIQLTTRTPEEIFTKRKVNASPSRNARPVVSQIPMSNPGPEAPSIDGVPGALPLHDIEAISLAISKDISSDVEEAFSVSEYDDTQDEIPTPDHLVRPWQYEDAESEEERSKVAFPMVVMDADSSDASTSDEEEEDIAEEKKQSWIQAARAARAKKRIARSNSSGYKRTLSVEIGSDTDEEDITPMDFEANEAGLRARRLRRKTVNDRSSLIFDDPPPRIMELSEPENCEEAVEDESATGETDQIIRPRKYEWEAPTQAELAIFQTSTFRNSHYNRAHFSSPNFTPEEWKPDPDEEIPERHKRKGAMRGDVKVDIKNNEEVSGPKNIVEDDVDRSDVIRVVTSPIIAFSRPTSPADAIIFSTPELPGPHHFVVEKVSEIDGNILPEICDMFPNETDNDQTMSQSPGETIINGIFYQDDDNRSMRSEVSNAPSLASVADSIFSCISGSSMSSVAGPVGAGERFVALLLEDSVIYPLCIEGLESILPERFERNFRRMLKEFAIHLRQEAATIQQRNAAHFVRFRARNSAHIVCSRLGDWKDVKKILPETFDTEADAGNDDIEGESDDSSSNESEDGLNDIQHLEMFIRNSRAIDLLRGQLHDFVHPPVPNEIAQQQKIRNLEKGVQETEQEITIIDGESEVALFAERGAVSRTTPKPNSQWQIPSFLSNFTITTRLCLPPVETGKTRIEWRCKCGQKIIDDFLENRPGGLLRHQGVLNSMKERGTEIRDQVLHTARKRNILKRGFVRSVRVDFSFAAIGFAIGAAWCVSQLFVLDNVSSLSFDASEFESKVSSNVSYTIIVSCSIVFYTIVGCGLVVWLFPPHRSRSPTCQSPREGQTDQAEIRRKREQQDSTNTDRISTTGSSKSRAILQSFQSFRSVFSFNSKASALLDDGLPLHSIPANTALASTPPPPPPIIPQDLLFLLLCYSEGRYATRLMQLDLVTLNATSDKALFKILRANYHVMRPRFSSFFSLRSLEWIKFVHFEMYKSELVDVRKVNDIPPPGHVEYKYAPAPPDVIPPVGDRHMMHLFRNPECADDDILCLSRFPKKLREKLKCQGGINPGWGLQFVEGWDLRKLWVLVYVLFGLGSLIFGVLWAVYKHTIQDAFAIAAYMLTFVVLTVGLVQALLIM